MQRCEVLEENLVLAGIRCFTVDAIHLGQREITLTFARHADLTVNSVAIAQVVAAHLRRRDVNVIRAGQIGGFCCTQKAVALLHDFKTAVSVDSFAGFRMLFEQREDQFLFAQAIGVLDTGGGGHVDQLTDMFRLEFG